MDLVNLRLMGGAGMFSRLPEQLGTLAELRDEGKLDLIGLSNAGSRFRLRQHGTLIQLQQMFTPGAQLVELRLKTREILFSF